MLGWNRNHIRQLQVGNGTAANKHLNEGRWRGYKPVDFIFQYRRLCSSYLYKMATRNRTNLYISYRQSYPHHPTQSYTNFNASSAEELDTLIPSRGDVAIEMDILPPAWADTTQQVDEILNNITKMSAKLDKLHARHVLPGFDDKREEEGEIERFTSEITNVPAHLRLLWIELTL